MSNTNLIHKKMTLKQVYENIDKRHKIDSRNMSLKRYMVLKKKYDEQEIKEKKQ